MTAQYVPLNNGVHKNLKVKAGIDFSDYEKMHMLPLVVQEFMPAATSFPIIFAKNAQSGEFLPVAISSLKPETNRFIKDGKWTRRYLPMQMRVAPFTAGPDEQKQNVMIGIDVNSQFVNEAEGEALFSEDGEQTEFLKSRVQFIGQLIEFRESTKQFIKNLTDHDLLQPKTLTVTDKEGKKNNFDGIYVVDEQKLADLSDEVKLDFVKKGVFAAVYAHLCSLNQIDLVMGE
ncbi:SapC family protein [Shewanella sedimentimangrovi]|uniref:SapC family protein n=1 Tax=Shewanella sedimentimangrovi TaxID=2814293 RepID=A0ABX7R2P4_9GAMM|nr:SapC family protein [Shewanella sedimentimangrovi]QSX38097.1 SapC family protein [Shewanella sedimentimangrovi]